MFDEVRNLLSDRRFDWSTRLIRLQGWRGKDARQAIAAGWAHRLAPGVCAAGGLVGALLASPVVLGFFGATAVIGTFAANHPVEAVYNALAPRWGRTRMPSNRAAKRLGCLLGSVHLLGAAVAFAYGLSWLGFALALPLAGLAAIVAVTGLCIPSIVYTIPFGAEAATAPSLWGRGPAELAAK